MDQGTRAHVDCPSRGIDVPAVRGLVFLGVRVTVSDLGFWVTCPGFSRVEERVGEFQ